MATSASHPTKPRGEQDSSKGGEYGRGMLYGVLPLAAVAAIIAVALLLAALVRQLIGVSAFLLQQQMVLITLGSGLILALVAFTLVLIFTLQHMARWQHDGYSERARAALWTLGGSALVILLPVLLAFVLP